MKRSKSIVFLITLLLVQAEGIASDAQEEWLHGSVQVVQSRTWDAAMIGKSELSLTHLDPPQPPSVPLNYYRKITYSGNKYGYNSYLPRPNDPSPDPWSKHERREYGGTSSWDPDTGEFTPATYGYGKVENVSLSDVCDEIADDSIPITETHSLLNPVIYGSAISKTKAVEDEDCSGPGEQVYSRNWDKAVGVTTVLSDPDTEEDALERAEMNPGDARYALHDKRGVTTNDDRKFEYQEVDFFGRIAGCSNGTYEIEISVIKFPKSGMTGEPKELVIADSDVELDDDGRTPTYSIPGSLPEGKMEKGFYYVPVSFRARLQDEEASAPGSGNARPNSIHFEVHLGNGQHGGSAGSLLLEAETISPEIYTPAGLRLSAAVSDGTTPVYETDGSTLRQVLAPQALADIVVVNAEEYRIDFYYAHDVGAQDQNGVFALIDSPVPFVSWTIKKVSTPTGESIKMVKTAGSTTTEDYQFTYELLDAVSQEKRWTLLEAGGARKTELISELDAVTGLRIVERRIFDSDDDVHYHAIEHFKSYSWGEELVKRIEDPNGEAWTSEWEYFDPSGGLEYNIGSNMGLLKSHTEPSGKITFYEYEGGFYWLTNKWSTYLDQDPATTPGERQENYLYDYIDDHDGDGKQEEIDSVSKLIDGTLVSRVYDVYWSKIIEENGSTFRERSHYKCIDPGDQWDDAANLETRTRYFADGAFSGKVARIIHPDGTVTTYDYEILTNGHLKEIQRKGAADSTYQVIDGEEIVKEVDGAGNLVSLLIYDIDSGILTYQEDVLQTDEFGRPRMVAYLDGTFETTYSSCCGSVSGIQRQEVSITYTYDDFGRIETEVQGGITKIYEYNPLGQVTKITRRGTDNSEIVIQTNEYDLSGRQISSRDAVQYQTADKTQFSETIDTDGMLQETTTFADGNTITKIFYPDGSLQRVTGTAAHPSKYEYGLDIPTGESVQMRFVKKIMRVKDDQGLWIEEEWVKTYYDSLNRTVMRLNADGTGETRSYNEKGQLVRTYRGPLPETTGEGVHVTLYGYDDLGNREFTIIDMDHTIDPESLDIASLKGGNARITQTRTDVLSSPDRRRTTTTIWTKEDDAGATADTHVVETSVSGLESWVTRYGITTHQITARDGTGGKTIRTDLANGSYAVQEFQDGRLQSLTEYTSGDHQISKVTYEYDVHGRLWKQIDARNGATLYSYYPDDQVKSITTPDPDPSRSGSGWSAQVTEFRYNKRGWQHEVEYPDNKVVTTDFWPTGEVKMVSGARTYPVAYAYDEQGRVESMTTWQDYDGSAGQAVTRWEYDPKRGWLTDKIYPDQNRTTYTYTALGQLETRTWDRGATATYGYTSAGELESISYTGESTPLELRTSDVEIQYDRRGLRESVTETLGGTTVTARTFDYADNWELEQESWTAGPLAGYSLHREFNDVAMRVTDVRLMQGTSVLVEQEIDYRPGSPHIASVSDLTVPAIPQRATFTPEPNSRMLANTKFYRDQTLVLEVDREWDRLGRLGFIGSSVASFTYDFNAANQRIEVATADGHHWDWTYDDLGQIKTAAKYRPDGQVVFGHDFEFTFDTIGNRTEVIRNGVSAAYTPNLLNQYEQNDVPGLVRILGQADQEAVVTVDQQATMRQEDLFYTELPVDNATEDVHKSIVIRGVKVAEGPPPENLVSDVQRDVFVAETPEEYTYDTDGNLTSDGRWNYTWNAENRLVRMEARVDLASNLPRQRLDFIYDSDGRRIRKEVFEWNSTFQLVSATRYIYNGWNLLAEIDETGAVRRSYLWGPSENGDLANTATPGSLLGLRDHSDDSFYFAQTDGNGNIMRLIASADGSQAASYEYGPFGESLRATGPMASANPIRFSSKMQDGETGLYYYGYRYYSPSMGRFLNRDPIGEQGGLNLYGFVNNDPINAWDHMGLISAGGFPGTVWPIGDPWRPSPGYDPYDPGEGPNSPFPEKAPTPDGWYRHCVENCKMSRRRPGNPIWECAVGIAAQMWGSDLPWDEDRDPKDIAANNIGLDLACLCGSCEDLCREAHPNNPNRLELPSH